MPEETDCEPSETAAEQAPVGSTPSGAGAPGSRAGLDEISDAEAELDAHDEPGGFSPWRFVQRHRVAFGLGAVAVVGTVFAVGRVRKTLPMRLFRAVRRRSLKDLLG